MIVFKKLYRIIFRDFYRSTVNYFHIFLAQESSSVYTMRFSKLPARRGNNSKYYRKVCEKNDGVDIFINDKNRRDLVS